jgi:hypothetical protein
VALESQNGEHGREAASADGHRVARGKGARHHDHAFGGHARKLRQAAPSLFANAEAVADHALPDSDALVGAGFDDAGEVDARHQRKRTRDCTLAGDG